jgi:hypothetical protein
MMVDSPYSAPGQQNMCNQISFSSALFIQVKNSEITLQYSCSYQMEIQMKLAKFSKENKSFYCEGGKL